MNFSLRRFASNPPGYIVLEHANEFFTRFRVVRTYSKLQSVSIDPAHRHKIPMTVTEYFRDLTQTPNQFLIDPI